MAGNFTLLSDENFSSGIQKGGTLVDFYADLCGPCRMLTPILEDVAKQIEGKAAIAKVDIDAAQKVASQFQITSVPTMILFKDGKEINRLVGLKNADAIKSVILAAV